MRALEEEQTTSKAELGFFLRELSRLSSAELLPIKASESFDARLAGADSLSLPGSDPNFGESSPTSSLDTWGSTRKTLFGGASSEVSLPSMELFRRVSMSDRYFEQSPVSQNGG